MDPVKFVAELEIEKRSISSRSVGVAFSSKDYKAQGFVNDGSLVSFTSNLKRQQKQDVLYSTLLAQLAANKKHDRFIDTEKWCNVYTDVLRNVGWVLQDFKFEKYQSSQSDLKISQITVELLAALIEQETDLMEVLKATIDNLEKPADAITLFGSSSASEKHGNFQIMPCVADKNNQITVAFLGSFFQASHVSDDFFFMTYSKQDIGLFKAVQSFTLDDNKYGKVRGNVIEKLGETVKKDIDEIDV